MPVNLQESLNSSLLIRLARKKREYVAMLEKGETDMQLSTFIMISEAVGLKFALTY